MKYLSVKFIVLASVGLLFLSACSNGNQTTSTNNNATSPTVSASPVAKTDREHGASIGGQIVETGAYHLEFVPEKEASATHMDLYLLKGDRHETLGDAKVTAQVQLPNGTQKSIPFTYDAKDKHYTALLSEAASGQYEVKVIADINGEKPTGRFNFNR